MKQKTSFSNFDVFIIVKELDERLNEGTIDNVYELEDLLILKINMKKNGKVNLIIKNDSRINITNYDNF
jgi:predicted ribosome quality control (RQC) complex YloA/Tae2 family protein